MKAFQEKEKDIFQKRKVLLLFLSREFVVQHFLINLAVRYCSGGLDIPHGELNARHVSLAQNLFSFFFLLLCSET